MKAEKIIIKIEPINIEIGEVTLLSIEEYREAEKNIKCVNNNWWLRSPGDGSDSAAFVYGETGDVGDHGHFVGLRFVGLRLDVRPALRIDNLQSLDLKAGDKIILAGHKWTVISDELALALCDEVIGKCAFREYWREPDANDYQKSDIKKWLEKWAKENGLSEEQMSEVKDES